LQCRIRNRDCPTATTKNHAISRQPFGMRQNAFGRKHAINGVVEMQSKKPRRRTKIKGKYMQVRQRSTKKGKKGTIMGKWKPNKKKTNR